MSKTTLRKLGVSLMLLIPGVCPASGWGADECVAYVFPSDPGGNFDDGLLQPDPAEIPPLVSLLAQRYGIANPENPSAYLGLFQTINGGVSVTNHDPQTMATTFSVPKADGSVAYVYIDAIQATPDNITFAGDVDGYAITGRAERTDDQVIVTINPEVLGISLKPMRVEFLVRKHVTSIQADQLGPKLSAESQGSPAASEVPSATGDTGIPYEGADQLGDRLELAPVSGLYACGCCGGTGACDESDCDLGNYCRPSPGTCQWGLQGGSALPFLISLAFLFLALAIGERRCRSLS